jgi:release factor glutamine methyltransferase
MPEEARALLGPAPPGFARWLAGKALGARMRLAGGHRYDDYRLEHVLGMPLLVLPSVANPRLLRTGAFFAGCLAPEAMLGRTVLDLGTGSGVCALAAARAGARVVAVDINPTAVRCAGINAAMNRLEHRIDLRHGDLFDPVHGERFDFVLFNPPFLKGEPASDRDAAWRGGDVAVRFARSLGLYLNPRGAALLLLSTFGDACESFIDELHSRGFELVVHSRRRYVNETLTLLCVARAAAS